MSAAVSLTDLLLLPALVGYTIWWVADLRRGARIHRGTLGLHLVVYGLAAFYIWAVSLGEIVLAGGASTPLVWVWTLVLSGVGVASVEGGLYYGSRRLVLEAGGGGHWRYRAPVAIAVFWLGLYLARFSLEDGLLGGYSVFLPTGPAPADVSLGLFIAVVLVVASLYLVSFGFLLGVSIEVWNRHGELLRSLGPGSSGRVARGPGEAPPGPAPGPHPEAGGAPALSCEACGSPRLADAAFCGECGARVAQIAERQGLEIPAP